MAQLAIQGHPTRGSEVIALLEMLGGNNKYHINITECNLLYTIREGDNAIIGTFIGTYPKSNISQIYTLERFLAQFPYKVGDKVYYDNKVCDIIEMRWNSNLNTISYGVCDGKMKNLTIKEDLKPYNKATKEFYNKYCINCSSQRCTAEGEWLEGCVHYKEETMSKNICDSCLDNEGCWVECSRKKQEREKEPKTYKKERKYNVEEYLKIWEETENGLEVVVNDKFELKEDNGKFYIIKKQPQYPKTYEECCAILNLPHSELMIDVPLHYSSTLIYLTKLLICRNAYWKIAGEQMGLGKPWEPDTCQIVYSIGRYSNTTVLHNDMYGGYFILEFPIEEMRDAFCENFEKLIEECKKLL